MTMSYKDALKEQTHRIRDYGMYIAFVVIVIMFTILTGGNFVKAQNIVNLVNATSFIAVLAIGMTLVIVIRHIDLSVGFLMGTLGALAAIFMEFWSIPTGASIPMVLLIGTMAGLVTAFLVAHLRIPAFVATLAGWLLYKGTLQRATRSRGSIIINNDSYNALGNGFIPDFPDFGFYGRNAQGHRPYRPSRRCPLCVERLQQAPQYRVVRLRSGAPGHVRDQAGHDIGVIALITWRLASLPGPLLGGRDTRLRGHRLLLPHHQDHARADTSSPWAAIRKRLSSTA